MIYLECVCVDPKWDCFIGMLVHMWFICVVYVVKGSKCTGFMLYCFITFCNVVDWNDLINKFVLKSSINIVGEV